MKKTFRTTIISLMLCCCGIMTNGIMTEDALAMQIKETPLTVSSATTSAKPTSSQLEESGTAKETAEWETVMLGMSMEEKVGQLLMAAYRKNEDGAITVLDEEIEQSVLDHRLGGVILFSDNIVGVEQTKDFISSLKALSEIPLFIGVDEEGGVVTRLSALGYSKVPPAGTMSAKDAYLYGFKIGSELIKLGFNIDFAPVADLNTNPRNAVIGNRAFSSDPEDASEKVVEFSKGLTANGIMPVVKHFPGHGDTQEDSHNGMASVSHDIDRIRSVEIVPFLAGIDEGAAVMVGHITTPNITGNNEPAIFSKLLLTDLLRVEYGYDGLIFTDAMDMGAVTEYYAPGEAAVKAIQAGVDVVLMPQDLTEAYNALLAAVEEGSITEERINESVERILKIKYPETSKSQDE